MSVHRRFLSILAEAVSKFDTIPAGPVEMLAELQRDKDAVRSEILHMLDRYAAKHCIPSDDEERRRLCGYVEALVGELFFGMDELFFGIEEDLDLFDMEEELAPSTSKRNSIVRSSPRWERHGPLPYVTG